MTELRAERAPGATLRIGITGPIGCGKSTVSGWLSGIGAAVVDADFIAREVTSVDEAVLAAIVRRFGKAVLHADGSLDRARLGSTVFADPAALADLEAIVHPAVRPRIEAAVRAAEAAGAPLVVIEAIKLVEGGYAAECDEVWLVTCSPGEQVARLTARGTSAVDAAARIAAQGDITDRLQPAATRVVETSGDEAAVRAEVLRLGAEVMAGRGRDRGGSPTEA